jgi:hypothetical protein
MAPKQSKKAPCRIVDEDLNNDDEIGLSMNTDSVIHE